MDGKHDIPAHTWILALAVFVIGAFLGIASAHSEANGALGILGLANLKLQGEVTGLRKELASQKDAFEALKASAAKASLTTPVIAPGDATPKAKPHR
jgi:hypothetical protein